MSEKVKRYRAAKLFTGNEWLSNQTVVVADGKILDLEAFETATDPEIPHHPIIAPAFIDLQIYGAHGKLLSVYPEASSLHLLYDYCSKGGASHFQPTVATNTKEVFFKCIDAVKEYRKEAGKGCIGLHVEGPWINTVKKGAHGASFIHAPLLEEVKELLEYGKEVITMITLAPEICSKEVIDLIHTYGVVVSAGHSNANYQEAMDGFDLGIKAATHLYNAMSSLQHREPGMVGAIFNHPGVCTSIVPDGYHVDFAAIKIAKKILQERLFAITDAVTETTEAPYPHHLVGDKYESKNVLSGSALTMGKSLYNLINKVGIEAGEALRMVSLYPARVMGRDMQWGKIEKGYEAHLVFLDESFKLKGLLSE